MLEQPRLDVFWRVLVDPIFFDVAKYFFLSLLPPLSSRDLGFVCFRVRLPVLILGLYGEGVFLLLCEFAGHGNW